MYGHDPCVKKDKCKIVYIEHLCKENQDCRQQLSGKKVGKKALYVHTESKAKKLKMLK